MSRLLHKVLAGLALAVVVYAAAVAWVQVDPLRHALKTFEWSWLAVALLASTVNYLLRFLKWELCLGWLDVRTDAPHLTHGRSLLIYLAGLSMSITPGKVGEVLRSVLLRASDRIPFARTAPVVVADRATDLVALVLLASAGLARHTTYAPVAAVTLALVAAGVWLLGSRERLLATLSLLARLPRLSGLAHRAEVLADASARVLELRRLLPLTALSVLGWGLECLGYYAVLRGFAGVEPNLADATFLWSITTLVGALSFLPGGLGASEGSLTVLASAMVPGVGAPVAVASTLLIRGATLWYGEVIGAFALLLFLRDPALRARADDEGTPGAA